jgi:hypothetical protein
MLGGCTGSIFYHVLQHKSRIIHRLKEAQLDSYSTTRFSFYTATWALNRSRAARFYKHVCAVIHTNDQVT